MGVSDSDIFQTGLSGGLQASLGVSFRCSGKISHLKMGMEAEETVGNIAAFNLWA
jgi:hypothetical protein